MPAPHTAPALACQWVMMSHVRVAGALSRPAEANDTPERRVMGLARLGLARASEQFRPGQAMDEPGDISYDRNETIILICWPGLLAAGPASLSRARLPLNGRID